ncbi:hypothetical protein [Corynebacterium pacaense]|uniref:hypothetical protein n=1 Tax=Corynebacterium pacaense TaxID=1816684 RepID=UPI0009BACE15|nr:hypothetical protein [Corynebacterium pacaense]
MTAIDFDRIGPEGMRTSMRERLAGHLRREVIRSLKDEHPDLAFNALATDLADEFVRAAARIDVDDYDIRLRRPRTTDDQLEQLADR